MSMGLDKPEKLPLGVGNNQPACMSGSSGITHTNTSIDTRRDRSWHVHMHTSNNIFKGGKPEIGDEVVNKNQEDR